MNRKLTEKQLDQVLERISMDGSLDQDTVIEIADSPQLWWNVRRHIAEQKVHRSSAWPPPLKWRRWLIIGVPAIAAMTLVIGIMTSDKVERTLEYTSKDLMVSTTPSVNGNQEVIDNRNGVGKDQVDGDAKSQVLPGATKIRVIHTAQKTQGKYRRSSSTRFGNEKSPADDEVKTEFIALTYGGRPESGQVVRVKVPSSMMVTLGLVSAVQKPTSMINADVVIGDDGMTHAIRFIR